MHVENKSVHVGQARADVRQRIRQPRLVAVIDLVRRQPVIDQHAECEQQREVNDIRRLDARDAAQEIIAQGNGPAACEMLPREGEGEDKSADHEKQRDAVVSGGKDLIHQIIGRLRLLITEMKQADDADVERNNGDDGEETQAVNLRDEFAARRRDAGEMS